MSRTVKNNLVEMMVANPWNDIFYGDNKIGFSDVLKMWEKDEIDILHVASPLTYHFKNKKTGIIFLVNCDVIELVK